MQYLGHILTEFQINNKFFSMSQILCGAHLVKKVIHCSTEIQI